VGDGGATQLTSKGMKRISITADDYGAHPLIDKGITDSIKNGSLDNVDCMMTVNHSLYQSSAAVAELHSSHQSHISEGKLSLGLHVSFTCGSPCSSSDKVHELLCDQQGRFQLMTKHNFKKINHKGSSDALRIELEAQLSAFMSATGNLPTHVSCHAGIGHLNANLARNYFEFCIDHDLPVRNPFLISRINKRKNPPNAPTNHYAEKTMMTKIAAGNGIKMVLSPPISGELNLYKFSKGKELYDIMCEYRQKGMLVPDYFIDNFYCNASEERLFYLLKHIYVGTQEMVVHPVYSANISPTHPIPQGIETTHFPYRVVEYNVLTQHGIVDITLETLHTSAWERFRMRKEEFIN